MEIKEAIGRIRKERPLFSDGKSEVALQTLISFAEQSPAGDMNNEKIQSDVVCRHPEKDVNKLEEAKKELPFILSGEYRRDCSCEHCKNMPNYIQTALSCIDRQIEFVNFNKLLKGVNDYGREKSCAT